MERTISVLNTLIEINNDRIEGYETALMATEEADLKSLFFQLRQTSQNCKKDLVNEVKQLGGTPIEGTKTMGKFFRVWMDVKAMITGKDRTAILNSCEYGEDVAVETYVKELEHSRDDISPAHLQLMMEQHAMIKADHDKIKVLRDIARDQNLVF